jgi:hypothetical protein
VIAAGARPTRATALARWLAHRADAWGVTWVVVVACLVLHDAVDGWTLALSAAVAAVYWLGYAVNDHFDADDDAHDPDKARTNYFVWYPMSNRAFGLLLLGVLAAVVLVLAHWGVAGIAVLVAYLVAMWTYSSPPFRLKHVPGVDLVLHAAFALTYPYVIPLLLIDVDVSTLDVVIVALLAVVSLGGQLEQQLRDLDTDEHSGGTFSTRVGRRRATALLRASALATVLLAAVALATGDVPPAMVPLALLYVPTLLHRLGWWRPDGRPAGLTWALVATALVYGAGLVMLAATTDWTPV